MKAPQCHICGETMTLHVEPDNSGYEIALQMGLYDPARFKAEAIWFECPCCGRKTHRILRDDCPDMLERIKTREEAIRETMFLYGICPDFE